MKCFTENCYHQGSEQEQWGLHCYQTRLEDLVKERTGEIEKPSGVRKLSITCKGTHLVGTRNPHRCRKGCFLREC